MTTFSLRSSIVFPLGVVFRATLLTGFVACSHAEPTALDELADYRQVETPLCDPFDGVERFRLDDVLQIPAPASESDKTSTGVALLEDGGSAIAARGWLTESAEKTIDIQYFIFSTDHVGLIAADFMLRAAERGVKVRLIVDDLLVEDDGLVLQALDKHPNIAIKIYNPNINIGKSLSRKLFNSARDFRGVNQRMHNKTFIVDGKVLITGGRNVADEYYDYDRSYSFRDRDILLIGGAVQEANRSFEDFWNHELSVALAPMTKTEFSKAEEEVWQELHHYACDEKHFWKSARRQIGSFPKLYQRWQETGELRWLPEVRFVSDPPIKNAHKGMWGGSITAEELISLVQSAKHSVKIQTPYLVTSELGLGLFRDAVKRGVKVEILTNSLPSTDNLMAFSGYVRNREALVEAGVQIFEFRPDAAIRKETMTSQVVVETGLYPTFGLHAKTMIVDHETLIVTTFNLDPRSANLNTECFVEVVDAETARKVVGYFDTEIAPENAWRVDAESNGDDHAPFGKRMKLFFYHIIPKSVL